MVKQRVNAARASGINSSTGGVSHTRAVLSSDPVTTRLPSGLNATLVTGLRWPSSTVAAGVAPDRSHTRAVVSADPVTTRLPSGLNATLLTLPRCPSRRVEVGIGLDRSQTRAE